MGMTGRRCRLRANSVAAIPIAALLAWGARNAEAGIAVSPLQQEIHVKPGAAAEFTLTLANVRRSPLATPVRVRLEIVDFTVTTLGSISFVQSGHSRSAASWIKLETKGKEIVVDPDQVATVKGRVRAPRGADGDYWAALLVTPVEPVREGGISVILRTASAVFVRVERRNHAERLNVKEVRAELPELDEEDPSDPDPGDAEAADQDDYPLKVYVDVENTGLVSCIANGKAHLYLSGIRKVATIPLHALSRRILPGEDRRFIGALPAPLPAGEYSLRAIFNSDSQEGQKGYKETQFTVDEETARLWKESCQRLATSRKSPGLSVSVEPLTVNAQPGRFTTAVIPITNGGGGTMQVSCRLNGDSIPQDWLTLDQPAFTLEPRMRHSVLCRINVPSSAEAGDYSGGVAFVAEIASLSSQPGVETATVPLHILVTR